MHWFLRKNFITYQNDHHEKSAYMIVSVIQNLYCENKPNLQGIHFWLIYGGKLSGCVLEYVADKFSHSGVSFRNCIYASFVLFCLISQIFSATLQCCLKFTFS